jgi:hypothetical protein
MKPLSFTNNPRNCQKGRKMLNAKVQQRKQNRKESETNTNSIN